MFPPLAHLRNQKRHAKKMFCFQNKAPKLNSGEKIKSILLLFVELNYCCWFEMYITLSSNWIHLVLSFTSLLVLHLWLADKRHRLITFENKLKVRDLLLHRQEEGNSATIIYVPFPHEVQNLISKTLKCFTSSYYHTGLPAAEILPLCLVTPYWWTRLNWESSPYTVLSGPSFTTSVPMSAAGFKSYTQSQAIGTQAQWDDKSL